MKACMHHAGVVPFVNHLMGRALLSVLMRAC